MSEIPRVYDIKSEFLLVQELLENEEFDEETGELIDNSKAIQALLSEIQDNKSNKADNIAFLLKQAKDSQALIKEEISRLKERTEMFTRQEVKLKELLTFLLGEEGLKTDKFTFFYKGSTSVNITNIDLIPDEYLVVKTTVTPDKSKIKKALQDGKEMGAEIIRKRNLGVK